MIGVYVVRDAEGRAIYHYPSSKLVAMDELFYVDPADGLLDVEIEARKRPRRLRAEAMRRGAA
jgi:hypothetical protein